MRMWMVPPGEMCDKHLLGEHDELHKFLHNWVKQHKRSTSSTFQKTLLSNRFQGGQNRKVRLIQQ